MRYPTLFLILHFPLFLGLSHKEVNFSIEYFSRKNVRNICMISCDKDYLSRKLSLKAVKYSLFISEMKMSNSYNVKQLNSCFEQKLTPVGILINLHCRKFDEIALAASRNKWFDDSHKWLVTDGMTQYKSDKNIETSVYKAVVAEEFKDNKTKITDTCDQTNPGSHKILENGGNGKECNKRVVKDYNKKELNKPFRTTSKFETVFKDLNISVDADITILKSSENQLQLYEVYNFGKELGGNLVIEKLENFNPGNSLKSTELEKYKYYKRWDFKQLPIRMAVVTKAPESFDPETLRDKDRAAPDIPLVTRSPAITLHVIAEMHNIKYQYNLMESWFTDVKDGNPKISVNSIYYKQSDLITALRYTYIELTEYIEYIFPHVFSIETRYYYRIPTKGPGKLENQFLTPLSTVTWLCILGIMPLCALILFQSSRLEQRPSPGQFAIFSVMAALCQQFFEDHSDEKIKKNSSARKLTVFVTGMFCVLIYNYYTSSVVSWLLNGPPPSINSLAELLESPLELIYEDIGYTRSWFKVQSYFFNKRNAAYELKIKKKVTETSSRYNFSYYKSMEEGIDLVKAGGYAYHAEVNSANAEISKKFMQAELCELGSLHSMEKTLLYAAVQKRSPYKEFFVWSLMRLKERGIIHNVKMRTTSRPFRCEGSSPRALALGGAAPAFLLLAIGYLAAVLLLFFERLNAKRPARILYPSRKQLQKFKTYNSKQINYTE